MAAALPDAPPTHERRQPPPLLASARALLEPETRELDRDPAHVRAQYVAQRYSAWLRDRYAAHMDDGRPDLARRALARLIAHERRQRAAGARHAHILSLLEQVCDAVQSSRGTGRRSGSGPHRSAIGLAAADLLGSIERAVGRGPRDLLTRRVWAWVRGHAADPAAAATMAAWVERARDVVDPPRPVSIVAACPKCHRRVAYVEDSGEQVRRPALQVDRATGWARCIAPGCHAEWEPARLHFLARVLEQQAAEDRGERGRLTVRITQRGRLVKGGAT